MSRFRNQFHALVFTTMLLISSIAAYAADATVDASTQYQIVHGFGACLYNPHMGSSTSVYTNDTLRNLYARDLGCSILRVSLEPTLLMAPGGNLAGPEVSLGSSLTDNAAKFNWEQARHRYYDDWAKYIQQNALETDRVKIVGAIWSPPHWAKQGTGATINGQPTPVILYCDTCDTAGGTWRDTYFTYNARYIAAAIRSWQNHSGIPFYALSIQNEATYEMAFNSCTLAPNHTFSRYANALKAVKDVFAAQGITTRIMGPHMAHIGYSPSDPYGLWVQTELIRAVKSHSDTGLINFMNIYTNNYDAHKADMARMYAAYWHGQNEVPGNWATWPNYGPGIKYDGKESWNSEAGGHAATYDGALDLAHSANNAMVFGHQSAWIYWQFCDGGSLSEHNLLGADQISNPHSSKKYCAFKHFSRYIRPGARRVKMTYNHNGWTTNGGANEYDTSVGMNLSAYVHSGDATVTMVIVNMRTVSDTLNITVPTNPNVTSYEVYRTTSTDSFAKLTNLSVSSGRVSLSVPARSIITLYGKASTGTPPAAPTNLTATAGNQQVALSWTASSGASSYNVKRSTTSGGPYSNVATGITTTSFTNTGLTNGTTYHYVVSAVNSNGESGNSNQASATPQASSTGSITREVWNNVSGTTVSSIPLSTTPSSTGTITSFEGPTNVADNYGTRIRGYLHAPTTGNYTFWIASDDDSELWLSTNDNPANKTRIAWVNGWTNSREWNKYASQKSAAISLTAGVRYYIEALHKEGGGGDNVAVGWARPGQSTTAPSEVIPGSVLSPWSGGGGTPPAAPTNLTATAGNQQVALSWTASSGASSYNVKRSTTSGGPYTNVATGITTTSFTNTGLTNGTTYHYVVSAVNSNGESGNSNQASATPTAPSSGTLLAHEAFSYANGALHNLNGGTGWGGAWQVQNNNTVVPGYNVANSSLLSYSTLARSGSYGVGGREWLTSGRALNVTSGGSFGSNGYLTGGKIGASGTTLWMSLMIRKDANNDDAVWVAQHDSNTIWHASDAPRVAVGYFGSASNSGGVRYWSLRIGSTVHRSNVAVTVGQTALLVVRVNFGSTTTADLFVNPSSLGGSAPSTANASGSTTSSMVFRNLGYYGGNNTGQSSIDEIRFGTTYSAVTPQ